MAAGAVLPPAIPLRLHVTPVAGAIDPDSVRSLVSRAILCLQKAVQLGNDAAALTALANHSVALFQSGASQHLSHALAMCPSPAPFPAKLCFLLSKSPVVVFSHQV